MSRSETAGKLVALAQTLTQERGFNGFSFYTLAEKLGIKTASVHYHFPTKGDLAKAMMEDYLIRFRGQLSELEQRHDGQVVEQLRAYLFTFGGLVESNHFCLCGMLTAECESIEGQVHDLVEQFYRINRQWLAVLLQRGRDEKAFSFVLPAEDMAMVLFASTEGGLLLYRKDGAEAYRKHCEAMVELVTLRTDSLPKD